MFLPFSLPGCDSVRSIFDKKCLDRIIIISYYCVFSVETPTKCEKAKVAKKVYKNDPKFTFYNLTL